MILKLKYNTYHLVENSAHPTLVTLALFNIAISLISTLAGILNNNIIISIISLSLSIVIWILDINLESNYYGYHTRKVRKGLNVGFLLFIVSEIAIFFSLFWAYFHNSLVPTVDIGLIWPPYGVNPIYPYDIALYGTLILFTSSITLTVGHFVFVDHNREIALYYILFTIILGLLFTRIQILEYRSAPFNIIESAYSSSFYILTGLHGIHVILGNIMLIIALINIWNYNCRIDSHLGFKLSILYWHFVDILWFFVYSLIYILPYIVTGYMSNYNYYDLRLSKASISALWARYFSLDKLINRIIANEPGFNEFGPKTKFTKYTDKSHALASIRSDMNQIKSDINKYGKD